MSVVAALMLAVPVGAEAQGTLADARELYAAAAYDDALNMLDGLVASARTRDERQSIELYRTLCFVALGRKAEGLFVSV